MKKTKHTCALIAASIFASQANAALTTLNQGSIAIQGIASSSLPSFFSNSVDDEFDTPGQHRALSFASARSSVAGLNGSVALDENGASARVDLLATGNFQDLSVGNAEIQYDATFTLTQATAVTLAFNSQWILGGGSGGPGTSSIQYNFGEQIQGSFEIVERSENQGFFNSSQTEVLEAGTYAFNLLADVSAPDQTSRLALSYALSFAQVPTPGSAAILFISGTIACAKRRNR